MLVSFVAHPWYAFCVVPQLTDVTHERSTTRGRFVAVATRKLDSYFFDFLLRFVCSDSGVVVVAWHL